MWRNLFSTPVLPRCSRGGAGCRNSGFEGWGVGGWGVSSPSQSFHTAGRGGKMQGEEDFPQHHSAAKQQRAGEEEGWEGQVSTSILPSCWQVLLRSAIFRNNHPRYCWGKKLLSQYFYWGKNAISLFQSVRK